MNRFSVILIGLLAFGTTTFAQEETKVEKVRPQQQSYEQRVERGFGQRQEPRWAGDRPGWMRQFEQPARGPMGPQFRSGQFGPRGPMMGQGRQFRGGFRGEVTIQRGCLLCEKHKEMVSKKHFAKKDHRGERSGKRGFERQRGHQK